MDKREDTVEISRQTVVGTSQQAKIVHSQKLGSEGSSPDLQALATSEEEGSD